MYRHALAVATATSAALLATAAPALADDTRNEPAGQCVRSHDVFSINVSPPGSLAVTVTADDIRGLMDTIVADSRLRGFFSGGVNVPAIPAVPYIMPWGALRAMPYDPRHALPGRPLQAQPGQPGQPGQPQDTATYQPGTGGASPVQPGAGGAYPGQPWYAGPSLSPSAAPSSSVSASVSASPPAVPSASPPAVPSASPSTAPSASASASPGLRLSPLNAYETSVPPVRTTFKDAIDRVLVCARSTTVQGAQTPPLSSLDTARIAKDLETLVINFQAACVTDGSSPGSSAVAGPQQVPPSLLGAIGVNQLLSTLVSYPASCPDPASANGGPTSILDAIGVTGLFEALTD